VCAALVLFFFQKDLGPALLLALLFLAMFAIARGGAWLAGLASPDSPRASDSGTCCIFRARWDAATDVAVAVG
jgi:hypothetical protein